MPLPGTRAVHQDWSVHHRATAASAMNATVEVRDRSTSSTYHPDTMSSTATAGTVRWSGPARVQALAGEAHPADQAGQEITSRGYLVQLDETGTAVPDVREGWTVRVLTAPNDPHVVGRPLRVTDVLYGSERFVRDLMCSDNLG